MRKWINLFESDFDYDFDDEIEDEKPVSKYPFLTSLQKKYQDKNSRRKDRVGSREKNRRSYEDHINDDDPVQIYSKATHKAVAGYKPFKIPLIRFGMFGKVSKTGFNDDEDTEETPWDQVGTKRRHENGVSCYRAYDNKDGTFTMLEPSMSSTWNSSNNPFVVAMGKFREVYEYLTTGKPMDVFLIYGHWVGEGKNGEYLTSGSDGEPLLDVNKPYKMERIDPEKISFGRVSYLDYMLQRYGGLNGMKRKIDRESATD